MYAAHPPPTHPGCALPLACQSAHRLADQPLVHAAAAAHDQRLIGTIEGASAPCDGVVSASTATVAGRLGAAAPEAQATLRARTNESDTTAQCAPNLLQTL
jgi:hypothetical protein